MQIKTLISPDIIRVPLLAEDRLGAIRELIELLGAQGLVSDVESAVEITWAREQERTTGIGSHWQSAGRPHRSTSSPLIRSRCN